MESPNEGIEMNWRKPAVFSLLPGSFKNDIFVRLTLAAGDAGHPLIKLLNPLAYTRFFRAPRTSL